MPELRKFKGDVIRFCVGNINELYSSIWRLWSKGNEDFYLAVRDSAHVAKFSFHRVGWRFAINENIQRSNPTQDRAMKKWQRPDEFIPGWTRCLGIIIPPRITKRPFKSLTIINKDLIFIDPPSSKRKKIFNIIISPKITEIDEVIRGVTKNSQILGCLNLKNEKVWLVCFEEDYLIEEESVVKSFFHKTKIHLKQIQTDNGINKAFLHMFSNESPYFITEIELGGENIERDLV